MAWTQGWGVRPATVGIALLGLLSMSAAAAAEDAAAPTCELLTKEAPAGGRLEVTGTGLGKSPLVKVGGKVARLLERRGDRIAVQIPKRSTGGEVTLHASKQKVVCGTLHIVGAN